MNEFKHHIEEEISAYIGDSFISFFVFIILTISMFYTDINTWKIKFYILGMIFTFGAFISVAVRVYVLKNMKQMIKTVEVKNEQK